MRIDHIIVLVLAAFLFAAAIVKVIAISRGVLSWPAGPNLFRFHIPLGLALAVEVIVGAAPLMFPSGLAAPVMLTTTYAIICMGAATLWGRECACFGIKGLRVGPVHLLGCMAATLVSVRSVVVPPTAADRAPQLSLWVLSVGAMVAGMLLVGRAVRGKVEVSSGGCLDHATRLQVFTIEDCSACAALKLLYGGPAGSARFAIDWYLVGHDHLPAESADAIRGAQFPSVVAVGAHLAPTCPRQEGLPDCQRMIDTFQTSTRPTLEPQVT